MCNASKKRIACLASGSGSNFSALVEGINCGDINGEIVCLITSNYEAFALKRAEKAGIKSFVCALKDFDSKERRDAQVLSILNSMEVDYVVLCGYLGVLSTALSEAYKDRIINIHPSLLPKFGGVGFFGLNVHKAVIEANEKQSGATAHFVDGGVDTGLIIAQESVEVLPSDTPETLQKRILDNVEHKLLVKVLKDLCEDRIVVTDGRVLINGEESKK